MHAYVLVSVYDHYSPGACQSWALVYYWHWILSGQRRNSLIGSSQTDSHLSLYCFIYLSAFFLFLYSLPTHLHLPCLPYNSLTGICPCFNPILKPNSCIRHLYLPIIICLLLLLPSFLAPLYPISPFFTLPSETVPPPFLVILHPPLSPSCWRRIITSALWLELLYHSVAA